MSDVALQVEGLGKKYVLAHQGPQVGKRYVALRDILTEAASAPFRRLARLGKGDSSEGSSSTQEDFWALRDVSFKIKHGESVGIIGRNGAGKSTLLKLLSRITSPTRGRIEINGRVASLLEVGTGFHPELTGRENVYLNGAIMGMKRAEIRRKFDEIVAFAEVERFLDTPVKRYSSGMYMRLAFAVAAHLDPEILVVDEVLAVGDAQFQKKCLGKMKDVGKSGRTVLFVSHNMEAITRLCSNCIYLSQGELKMQGETRSVINAYSQHSKEISNEVDLTRLARRFEGTDSARLLKLRCTHLENGVAWCYEFGMPIEFTMDFSVFHAIERPEIGYALFSSTGMELLSTTTQQESPLPKLLPGTYSMKMTIPDLALNPGIYTLSVGIVNVEGRNIDNVGEAVQIEVIPSEESIRRGLYRIYAPITPRTLFKLEQRET